MILWYAGCALAIVWNVFRDPAIDHRLIVAGVLLPDAGDLAWGRPALFHTLLAPAAALTLVMAATHGRRQARRRFLAVPIGMFLHLVLAASWAQGDLLWWPVFGAEFPDGRLVTEFPLVIAQELVGAWALGWFVWRFRLADAAPRRRFLRTGRLQKA
ncbi:MAG: hypothetical protein ACRDY7_16790 [Acidimicrobiia bacterium]